MHSEAGDRSDTGYRCDVHEQHSERATGVRGFWAWNLEIFVLLWCENLQYGAVHLWAQTTCFMFQFDQLVTTRESSMRGLLSTNEVRFSGANKFP
jgi:hypothetical protein